MNIGYYRNNPEWRRSIGEKIDKVHFRNGHLHTECDSVTGSCSSHYDEHDPHESVTELIRHVWKSDLGKIAIVSLGALAVIALASRK